jgi:hypothetical protein
MYGSGRRFLRISNFLQKVVPQLRRLVAGFPPRRPGFEHRSGYVGFVVDRVHWSRFSPSTSVSPANCHSTDYSTFIIIIIIIIIQLVADVPSGLRLTPPQKTKTFYQIIWRPFQ